MMNTVFSYLAQRRQGAEILQKRFLAAWRDMKKVEEKARFPRLHLLNVSLTARCGP